ncbi:hypothetical protein N665_0171s0052 [Sinapis alba]|nr:hypothetical protein N665_0171s0052 [Sinapis alba]
MADVENQQDSSFPVKRKSDLCCQDEDNVANKAQKLNPCSNSKDGQVNGSAVENLNSLEKAAEEKEEEEGEDEDSIDRKGKGISREDKGKGKLIEVDESDDSDDDDDEYDESDLSDDPLAEVDLDNILPSRTRRRSNQPGVYISNDRFGNHEVDDDDDDSSDDSDA